MMKVGLYVGSFNPFHRGHFDILLKAEKLFDRVIIARGINPEKEPSIYEIPQQVHIRAAVMEYSGLLTDFIEKVNNDLGVKATVIRGLRNSIDLQYEMNQYRYLQDLMPEIQMVSIFCDKEYEHISSSGIRMLMKYGDDKVKGYLLKD